MSMIRGIPRLRHAAAAGSASMISRAMTRSGVQPWITLRIADDQIGLNGTGSDAAPGNPRPTRRTRMPWHSSSAACPGFQRAIKVRSYRLSLRAAQNFSTRTSQG